MEIHPTTIAFWSHWREEHENWKIVELPDLPAFVATDINRRLSSSNMDFSSPIDETATITREVCETRADAHTYIALRCVQYALEKLGVL